MGSGSVVARRKLTACLPTGKILGALWGLRTGGIGSTVYGPRRRTLSFLHTSRVCLSVHRPGILTLILTAIVLGTSPNYKGHSSVLLSFHANPSRRSLRSLSTRGISISANSPGLTPSASARR